LGQDGGIERARRAGMDEAVGYDEVLGRLMDGEGVGWSRDWFFFSMDS